MFTVEEELHATWLGDDLYRFAVAPAWATGVAYGDVVRAVPRDGQDPEVLWVVACRCSAGAIGWPVGRDA